jgi:formylglycine-generating enzyme required for sulfatase activity
MSKAELPVVAGLMACALVVAQITWNPGWRGGPRKTTVGARADADQVTMSGGGDGSAVTSGQQEDCTGDLPRRINSLGMELVYLRAGRFEMGSGSAEDDLKRDEHRHWVHITRPFYLGAHEVTVGQFRRFAESTRYQTQLERSGREVEGCSAERGAFMHGHYDWRHPGYPQSGDHPVVYVSWHDATAFCAWLGEAEGRHYRLPTEAEWEYACRAGTKTRFATGDDDKGLRDAANVSWFGQVALVRRSGPNPFTRPVGSYAPNPFGLYDMHGNVAEWCGDWYDPEYYSSSPRDDPAGPAVGKERIVRGGSFYLAAWHTRCSHRCACRPELAILDLGFRIAADPD